MTKLPYETAFESIRAVLFEMPGVRLTPESVERLTGVSRSICQSVLDDLVRSRFLWLGADGSYGRLHGVVRLPTQLHRRHHRAVPSRFAAATSSAEARVDR